MIEQQCPICNEVVKPNPRYPNYVCSNCLTDGLEINGQKVSVSEIDIYSSTEVSCSVKGVNCCAKEARFGGAVVQTI